MMLKGLGFAKVDIAINGAEAVQKTKQNPLFYDLILMDISMPVMGGIEAARLIRLFEQENRKSRVPIIAVTGISDRDSCLAAGMDDFMTKPFLLEHLRASAIKWMKLPVT